MLVSPGLEKELLLVLVKNFSKDYNSSNIAKVVKKSRIATFKALRSLENKGLVVGKPYGKARFYKAKLEYKFAQKTIELILMDEANRYQRWVEEFREILSYVNIAVLFGSIVRNEGSAKDIDLLLAYPARNNLKVMSLIKSKNSVLTKKIHLLRQTKDDLSRNIKNRDGVILDAISKGIVLQGYSEIIEMISNEQSKGQGRVVPTESP